MSVRIYLEIGHEASIRTKKTQEGFTHDWEVYVKGCNDAEIHYYVEKVVFYLHETFPKPKRVIKEPPYLVKESGYAGFNLPIDIYLRNNHDPKKLRFNYDLRLQPSGPTLHSSQKEKYTFTSPSDDFRDKLLKGGGKLGSTLNVQETSDNRTLQDERGQMVNKPKLSGLDNNFKKHKVKLDDPKSTNSSFLALFGIPITTSQMTREKTSISKSVNKHSPQKDNQKDKEKSKIDLLLDKKSKDEKKFKDKSKEHEKSKDKNSKKDRSPLLKVSSPKRSSPRRSPPRSSPILHTHKHKESKYDKDKRDRNDERKSRKEKRDHKENKQKDNHEETFNKNMDYKDSKNRIDIKNFIKQKDITCVSPPPARLCNDIKDKTKFLTKDDKIVLHDEKKTNKIQEKR